MKKIFLIRFISFLVFFVNFNYIHAKSYRVVAQSSLNIRSAPNKYSNKLSSVSNGQIVNMIQEESNGWMKIEANGITGYVYGKYLEAVPDPSDSQNSEESFFDISQWYYSLSSFSLPFWACIVLYIILSIAFYLLLENHIIIAMLCNFGAARCLWQHTNNDFWSFLNFKENGFFLYVFYLFLIYAFITYVFSMFRFNLSTVLSLFKKPLVSIIGIITAFIYFFVLMDLVLDIFQYHTGVVLIVILGCISSSSSYVGTFTDRNGNTFDVYKD